MRKLPLLLLVGGSCAHQVALGVPAPATLHLEPDRREQARVLRAVDGDTIEVEVTGVAGGAGTAAGETYDVRLIGVDAPESVSPREPVECYGPESSAAAAALLEGERVTMVPDVEDRDGFGRLLRYVYVGAEQANARLVANGYATAYPYPPNVRWSSLFVRLEHEARAARRGLWSSETCEIDVVAYDYAHGPGSGSSGRTRPRDGPALDP